MARQPVLDGDMSLLGYELLVDGAAVVVDALSEVGLEALTGGHVAWLPLGRDAAAPRRPGAGALRPRRAPGAGRRRRRRGAASRPSTSSPSAARASSLDDVAYRPGDRAAARRRPGASSSTSRPTAPRACASRSPRCAAATSSSSPPPSTTPDDLALCRRLGFAAFQGAFVAEPEIVPGRAVPTRRLDALSALADLQASVTFEDVERTIVRDVGLSHKLLRFANSALFARSQRVGSVREAMMLLGARGVQRWATVARLAGMPDQPHVLLVTALVRARMCELLSDDPAAHGPRVHRRHVLGDQPPARACRCARRSTRCRSPTTSSPRCCAARAARAAACARSSPGSSATSAPPTRSRAARSASGAAYRDAVAWADDTAASLPR